MKRRLNIACSIAHKPDLIILDEPTVGIDLQTRNHILESVKKLDIATPVTYERYCGAYKGSWMSFGLTPEGKQLRHNGKIKDINNIYMAGQWLMSPGGLPVAALTGKWAVQRLQKDK